MLLARPPIARPSGPTSVRSRGYDPEPEPPSHVSQHSKPVAPSIRLTVMNRTPSGGDTAHMEHNRNNVKGNGKLFFAGGGAEAKRGG
jgi:hypothetical protein